MNDIERGTLQTQLSRLTRDVIGSVDYVHQGISGNLCAFETDYLADTDEKPEGRMHALE